MASIVNSHALRTQSKRLVRLYEKDGENLKNIFLPNDEMAPLREIGNKHFVILDDHDMIWFVCSPLAAQAVKYFSKVLVALYSYNFP